MTVGCEVAGCPFYPDCLGVNQLQSDLRSMAKGSTERMDRGQAQETADAYLAAGCKDESGLNAEVAKFPEKK